MANAIKVKPIIRENEINCFCISSLLFCLLYASFSLLDVFETLSVNIYPIFPITYTTVNINTQTTSINFQYKLDLLNLDALYKFNPRFALRINNVVNQQIPKRTCPPWNPTSAKNQESNADDRKLKSYSIIQWVNSYI